MGVGLVIDRLAQLAPLTLRFAARRFGRDARSHQARGPKVDQRQRGAGVHFDRAPERCFDIKKFAPRPALKPVANEGFGDPCRQILRDVDDLEGLGQAGKPDDPEPAPSGVAACAMGVTRT